MKSLLASLSFMVLSLNSHANLEQDPTQWFCVAKCKFVQYRGEVSNPQSISSYWTIMDVDTKDYVPANSIIPTLRESCIEIMKESEEVYNVKHKTKISSGERKAFEDWVESELQTGRVTLFNGGEDVLNIRDACLPNQAEF